MSVRHFAAYTSSRASVSRSSYSSTRLSTPSKSYSSTRTSIRTPAKSYTSTRTTSPAVSKSYASTRPSTITRSNVTRATSNYQRTTVVNNYYHDHLWYNSFFHPFGWGYGNGNFWMWMWLFDRDHYNTNQQIVQTQSQNGQVVQLQDNSWIGTSFILLILVGSIAGFWWLARITKRHFLWIR